VRAPPSRLCIKPLLLALDTFPAEEMQPIVLADRFDYMIGFAIASFAAMDFVILQTHEINLTPYRRLQSASNIAEYSTQ